MVVLAQLVFKDVEREGQLSRMEISHEELECLLAVGLKSDIEKRFGNIA
jgi:hypothetical protein